MKYLSPFSKIFFAAAALVFAIWLLMEKCNKDRPSLSDKEKASYQLLAEQRRLRDSAFKEQTAIDERRKADSAHWKKVTDSAAAQLAITKNKLEKSQTVAADLAASVKEAYANKDTSLFISSCRKLGDSVIELNARVDNYKHQVDTLLRAKDSLLLVAQKRLEDRDQFISTFRNSTNKTDSAIASMERDNKKAARKAVKKYTIILGGGPCITTNGKPGGGVGIFLGRNIIRL